MPLYLKLHPGDEPAEGVLVAWSVTLEGRKCTASQWQDAWSAIRLGRSVS